jgi:hypothetical protein
MPTNPTPEQKRVQHHYSCPQESGPWDMGVPCACPKGWPRKTLKVRTVLPKKGELRDRAILGGEPSL